MKKGGGVSAWGGGISGQYLSVSPPDLSPSRRAGRAAVR